MAKTKEAIRGEIRSFSTNRDALRDQAHSILMDILIHIAPEGAHNDAGAVGDTTLAYEMLKEMPKSWAEQARVWFDTFSPIRVIVQREKHGLAAKYKELGDKGTPGYIEDKDARKAERLTWWKLSEAQDMPFYKTIEEPEVKQNGSEYYSGFFDAQIKVIENQIEKKKTKPEAIPAALATIAKLKAAKALVIEVPAEATNDDATTASKAAAG